MHTDEELIKTGRGWWPQLVVATSSASTERASCSVSVKTVLREPKAPYTWLWR